MKTKVSSLSVAVYSSSVEQNQMSLPGMVRYTDSYTDIYDNIV